MDTENFVLERSRILDRLGTRRAIELEAYPFQMMQDFGVQLPPWARLGLSFISKGSVLSRFLEVGLPLIAPLIITRKLPFVGKLVQSIFTRKS